MCDKRLQWASSWRPILGLAAGVAMLVGWWLYEPEGTGWKPGFRILLLMVGAGLIVDSSRQMQRGSKE